MASEFLHCSDVGAVLGESGNECVACGVPGETSLACGLHLNTGGLQSLNETVVKGASADVGAGFGLRPHIILKSGSHFNGEFYECCINDRRCNKTTNNEPSELGTLFLQLAAPVIAPFGKAREGVFLLGSWLRPPFRQARQAS